MASNTRHKYVCQVVFSSYPPELFLQVLDLLVKNKKNTSIKTSKPLNVDGTQTWWQTYWLLVQRDNCDQYLYRNTQKEKIAA